MKTTITIVKRRLFLKQSLAAGLAAFSAAAGLLQPSRVLAASWNSRAFNSGKQDEALKALFGSSSLTATDQIQILAPPIAENGAVVNILVKSKLPGVTAMAILVDKNPNPLATYMKISSDKGGYLKTRVKMGKTSRVTAIVESGGKLHSASTEVKVTLGGCGGTS